MSYTILPRESEEQWLEERRTRVTATDIARLASGGPATWATVKAEKRGGSSFVSNRYTEWGHEREPFIASHVEFSHGITANDALYVNGNRAATPDGVSADRNGEYKTTVRDWEPIIEAIPRNYLDQVYWAQDVRGVGETVFAWEPHERFIPGPIRTLVIPRDDERLKVLAEVEARFLEFMSEDDTVGEWDDLIALAASLKPAVDEAQAAYDAVLDQIRERAGDREVAAKTAFGSVSLAYPEPRATFDSTAFKTVHPDLYAEFTKTTPPTKPTLRVTV